MVAPAATTPKMLVLGLGNPVVADDAVGLRVVEALRPRLVGRPGIEVPKATTVKPMTSFDTPSLPARADAPSTR